MTKQEAINLIESMGTEKAAIAFSDDSHPDCHRVYEAVCTLREQTVVDIDREYFGFWKFMDNDMKIAYNNNYDYYKACCIDSNENMIFRILEDAKNELNA